MNYVEAPNLTAHKGVGVFLAGGITGCPDWQQETVTLLEETDLTLFNPRRANFPMDDPSAAEAQITWEWLHLQRADAVLFWFPKETLCPIVLFELGKMLASGKPLFIGVHPEYERKQDVEIQTRLERRNIEVVGSLEEMATLVKGTLHRTG